MYIFIDESGDLGFKKSSSKWFVFTMAIVTSARSLEHVVKKVWRSLKTSDKNLGELHAHRAPNVVRKRMLKKVGDLKDLKILAVVLDKSRVPAHVRTNADQLYTRIARMLFIECISREVLSVDEQLEIIIDRKDTSEKKRDDLLRNIQIPVEIAGFSKTNIVLASSHKEKSLQAVDFISWAIFRKYETNDLSFYKLLENKIIEEELLTIHSLV